MGAISRAEVGERTFLHADMETMPREQLAQLQVQRLRTTVTNAYEHVPFVKQRLQAAGMKPADVKRAIAKARAAR